MSETEERTGIDPRPTHSARAHRALNGIEEEEPPTFRWKDYARGNKQRLMTLSASEFLRRYVQHVLPHGFVRIRQFGFLANGIVQKALL
jgi:hypothetical protein